MKKGQQKKVTKIRTKPSRKQAEEAVKTLIQWAGDNPDREGLLETPKRVVNAYKEFFAGYDSKPEQVLSKTFDEVEGYDEMAVSYTHLTLPTNREV